MVTLPSKKVLSVFVLTIALVAAIIIAFGRDKSSEAINFANNLIAGEKVSIPENPNWQNELSGVSENSTLAQAEESISTEETLTDTVSRTLMSNYLGLKQSGNLDSTSAQELIDKTLEYIGTTGSQTIEVSQLNVIADNGKQSIADYGENLGMIFKINKPKSPKEAFDIVSQVIQSNNASKMNELDSIIVVYQKITVELIKMPVPKTFVKAHLDITKSVKNAAAVLTEIKSVFNDPFKSLTALQLFQNSANIFVQAIQATHNFIMQNNIVYKQGSGGYYLLYGI